MAGVASSLLVLAWAGPASATWSIVAVDDASGEVGVALASCVPAPVLGEPDRPLAPIVLIPGRAAAVTQGQFDVSASDRIRELLEAGASPGAIVEELQEPSTDPAAAVRQHGLVATGGEVAAFSGDDLPPSAGDRQGTGVTVQGNLLVSEQVLDESLRAFEDRRQGGGGLAPALVEGLVAGAQAGGDRRCGEQTALFAQLVVARATDDPGAPPTVLTVTVEQGDGQNPVEILADALDEGRTGLIDAGRPTRGGGAWILWAALAGGLGLAGAGGFLFRRGLGQVRARR